MDHLNFITQLRQYRAITRATGRNYDEQLLALVDGRAPKLAEERGIELPLARQICFATVQRETGVVLDEPAASE